MGSNFLLLGLYLRGMKVCGHADFYTNALSVGVLSSHKKAELLGRATAWMNRKITTPVEEARHERM